MTAAQTADHNPPTRPPLSGEACRWDAIGPIRWMADVDEFVVVRRLSSAPFVMRADEYMRLPDNAGDERLAVVVQWGVVEQNMRRRMTDKLPYQPPADAMSRVVGIDQAR